MPIDTQLLQNLPLFASLPADELRLLADRMRPCRFADGELVLREGEQCKEFYIVVAGQVAVVKALGTPDERLLGVRSAGTMVGELSLFSPGGRHSASVLAHGPLDMLAMTRADFDNLLARQPRLVYGMVETLSLRLIESEQTTIRELHAKNDALAAAFRSLQAAQAQLVEKEKMERELQVARRIQCSLLCNDPPHATGCELGALTEAMSAVGGDFYDFIDLPDGRIGIAIGDVSDHGVPAALFVTMTITLLRSALRREATPAGVLRSVNGSLLEFNMSGMFVTVLYGVLDPRARDFTYARAGHEPPLLHLGPTPQPATGASSSFQRGQALGIFTDPEFDERSLRLPPGSTLLLYTDGAREAWNGAGTMFGEEGLRGALAETEGQPAQTICDRIFERLADHRERTPQQDDVTLVAVKNAW